LQAEITTLAGSNILIKANFEPQTLASAEPDLIHPLVAKKFSGKHFCRT
jgi:hypothetical protein